MASTSSTYEGKMVVRRGVSPVPMRIGTGDSYALAVRIGAPSSEAQPAVRSVIAIVSLQPAPDRAAVAGLIAKMSDITPRRAEQALQNQFSPDRLKLHVMLSAELTDGSRVSTGKSDMGIGCWRRGTHAIHHRYHGPPLPRDPDEAREVIEKTYRLGPLDIQDAINQLLGRDPEQHRPPRLAWANLINELKQRGIVATEQQLIETPLTLELNAEVQHQLGVG